MTKLPDFLIEKMNSFLKKYGFIASEDYLNELVEGTYLKESILDIQGFDTAEREQFFNILGQKLTGMDWPCNADSDQYMKKFQELFLKGIKEEKSFTIL